MQVLFGHWRSQAAPSDTRSFGLLLVVIGIRRRGAAAIRPTSTSSSRPLACTLITGIAFTAQTRRARNPRHGRQRAQYGGGPCTYMVARCLAMIFLGIRMMPFLLRRQVRSVPAEYMRLRFGNCCARVERASFPSTTVPDCRREPVRRALSHLIFFVLGWTLATRSSWGRDRDVYIPLGGAIGDIKEVLQSYHRCEPAGRS